MFKTIKIPQKLHVNPYKVSIEVLSENIKVCLSTYCMLLQYHIQGLAGGICTLIMSANRRKDIVDYRYWSIDYLSFNDLKVLRNKLHPSNVGPNELSPSAKLLKNHVIE